MSTTQDISQMQRFVRLSLGLVIIGCSLEKEGAAESLPGIHIAENTPGGAAGTASEGPSAAGSPESTAGGAAGTASHSPAAGSPSQGTGAAAATGCAAGDEACGGSPPVPGAYELPTREELCAAPPPLAALRIDRDCSGKSCGEDCDPCAGDDYYWTRLSTGDDCDPCAEDAGVCPGSYVCNQGQECIRVRPPE
jgi:hypothetical protein